MMNNEKKKVTLVISVFITVVALIFSLVIILGGSKETEFTINTETSSLEISGFYSKTIIIDENTQISLISPLIITQRTNGSSVGNTKKGYFTLEGDLAVYLNLSDSTLDWIEIVNGDEYYYINLKSVDDTTQLMNDLNDLP